jgi:hypothetical protein
MTNDGLGRKLVVAGAAVGAILLALRIVGGRGGEQVDEGGIDRVDTGRSDEDRDGPAVETGLERVSTDEADGDGAEAADDGTTAESGAMVEADGTDAEAETGAGTGAEAVTDEAAADAEEPGDDDDGTEEVPVAAARGRFDDLDLFDLVAIASAAFDAARKEYRDRV